MEARVISKVSRRIVPFVALCYFVCYLDRVNVGFAALQMNSDLGFTATVFGWGAGIFFVGYFFFEVPSNLALERFGARLWIARIMVTWGLLSAAMALIWNGWSFLHGASGDNRAYCPGWQAVHCSGSPYEQLNPRPCYARDGYPS
jgi:MFS transporter, ACS family, tartrate transporter